jgi:hypothetical protein
MWHATRKRGEKATAVEKLRVGMKSASAKSLVNGRSQVRAVTCHLNDDAEKRQAGEQSKRINRVYNCTESVLGQSGGAERTTSSSCQVRAQARRLS